ncbi:hypothetical protein P378_11160 [Desulforamulus profundi]|uniref:Uncharacterized protein n=1 Tax=Desulforamulus profundi TaxID=1383067 RepID=A0A2C6MG21_9FIRM|nr:hypothetical protein P378_11160 [Desulforamulus profundi]
MKYRTVAELVALAREHGKTIGEVVLEQEVQTTGRAREEIFPIWKKPAGDGTGCGKGNQ